MNSNTIKEKINTLLDGNKVVYPVTNSKSRNTEKGLNSKSIGKEPKKSRWSNIKNMFTGPKPDKTPIPIPNHPKMFTGPKPDNSTIPNQQKIFNGSKPNSNWTRTPNRNAYDPSSRSSDPSSRSSDPSSRSSGPFSISSGPFSISSTPNTPSISNTRGTNYQRGRVNDDSVYRSRSPPGTNYQRGRVNDDSVYRSRSPPGTNSQLDNINGDERSRYLENPVRNTKTTSVVEHTKKITGTIINHTKNALFKLYIISSSIKITLYIQIILLIIIGITSLYFYINYDIITIDLNNVLKYIIYFGLCYLTYLTLPTFIKNNFINQTIQTLLLIGSVYFACLLLEKIYKLFFKKRVVLINGIKNSSQSKIITQTPDSDTYINVSHDEKTGIEFTYNLWIYIKSSNFKKGTDTDKPSLKHIFHKGDNDGSVLYSPGAWLLSNKNTIRININTIKNKNNIIDIDNVPIDQWFNMSIVAENDKITIYINGKIKSTKVLDSIIRQNKGNIYVNIYNGFDGYISNLIYYNRSLSHFEVENMSSSFKDKNGLEFAKLSSDWFS